MLEEYQKKRQLKRSGEPAAIRQAGQGPLTFVIQKHAARRLHYDFRLELDGVLKSWAVPNGPSLDPKVKRLAVMVEDHPLDYASFEGVIPQGEYGAGQVEIWDNGSYAPQDEKTRLPLGDREGAQELMRDGLAKGKVSIFLHGHRLQGSWALVKMQRREKDWLLIKHSDEFARTESAGPAKDPPFLPNPETKGIKTRSTLPAALKPENIAGSRLAEFPSSIPPMMATPVDAPFSNADWLFEPKLDGFRTIARIKKGNVKLISRNGLDVTKQYPIIAGELQGQRAEDLVLDGEITALDESGKPCFQCLQDHLQQKPGDAPIVYYVFDILYLNGYALIGVPLEQRKKLLERTLPPTKHVRLIEYFDSDGETLFETAKGYGFEGIMAKLKKSVYQPGRRSRDWLKIKTVQSDDFIIGGYTAGEGSRSRTFGALLLGFYNDSGELVFTGHVGSGFDEPKLVELKQRLDLIKSDESPFASQPPVNAPVTWVRPGLVAEVKFSERTREGYLRAPVFLRLREDKSPQEVYRVESVSAPRHEKNKADSSPTRDKNPDLLKQLENPRESFKISTEGCDISLSNMEKPLWPALDSRRALTKRDFIKYLVQVSPYLLNQLRDRPLTLRRFPNGISGEHFYQKHLDSPVPKFVKTVLLSEHGGASGEYIVCNNLATLLWLGQLADIELHAWYSRIISDPSLALSGSEKKTPDFATGYPDYIVFDLDPYIYSGSESKGDEPELNRQAFARTCEVALWLKETLDSLSLTSFVKTSGRTGLHIYTPVLRQYDYTAVRAAAETIARFVLQHHQREITIDWTVEKRAGKIFIDYNQNARGKTLASAYSPRASPEATVSTPLRWEELGRVYPTDFTILTVPDRLAKIGDLWADILEERHDLAKLLE